MERNGKSVEKKWVAYVSEIKSKFITAELLEVYPEKSLLRYYINLPIDIIGKDNLKLGKVFYLYSIDGKFEIEWMKHHEWTQEEIQEVDNRARELMKNIKWDDGD
jgi:hypothetical protein